MGTGVSEERDFSIFKVEVGSCIHVYNTVRGVRSQNNEGYENLSTYLVETPRVGPFILLFVAYVDACDSCGIGLSVMSWFIILYGVFLLSSR